MPTFENSTSVYSDFYAAQRRLPVFCAPWYLDAVALGGRWGATVLLEDGVALAAWPYFQKKRWGLRYVTMPHFTKYLGPLCADGHTLTAQQWKALAAALPPFDGLDQQCSPSANLVVALLPESFLSSPHHTYRIDLSDTAWQGRINRNMRRNIRKAASQLQLQTSLDLQTFYAVHLMSFKRQGISPPYGFSDFQRHDAALVKQGQRQVFAAVDDTGQIHSVAYLIWDAHAAYYHLSGDNPALRSSGSGIWLIDQAIRYTQTVLQLPLFDFEGSMIPAVAAIREQFGAEKTTYYRIQSAASGWYRLLKKWKP